MPWRKVIGKLVVSQLVKKSQCVTEPEGPWLLSKVCNLSLSWNILIESMLSCIISLNPILFSLLHLCLPSALFLSHFPVHISLICHTFHMPCPSLHLLFDHSNSTWWGVNILQLIMQYCPVPYGVGPSHDVACPQVAGGGDGLQMWRVGSTVSNNLLVLADKGWFSILWVGWGFNDSWSWQIDMLRRYRVPRTLTGHMKETKCKHKGEGVLSYGFRHPAKLLCKQQPGALRNSNGQTSRTDTDSQHEGPRGGRISSVSHEPDCAGNYQR